MRKSHSYWILPFSLLFVENPTFPCLFKGKHTKFSRKFQGCQQLFLPPILPECEIRRTLKNGPENSSGIHKIDGSQTLPRIHLPSTQMKDGSSNRMGVFQPMWNSPIKGVMGKSHIDPSMHLAWSAEAFPERQNGREWNCRFCRLLSGPLPWQVSTSFLRSLWQQLWNCDNLNIQVSNTLDLGGQLWEPSTSRQLVFWWCCRDFLRFVRICLDQKRHSNRNPPAVWPNSSPWGVGLGGGGTWAILTMHFCLKQFYTWEKRNKTVQLWFQIKTKKKRKNWGREKFPWAAPTDTFHAFIRHFKLLVTPSRQIYHLWKGDLQMKNVGPLQNHHGTGLCVQR